MSSWLGPDQSAIAPGRARGLDRQVAGGRGPIQEIGHDTAIEPMQVLASLQQLARRGPHVPRIEHRHGEGQAISPVMLGDPEAERVEAVDEPEGIHRQAPDGRSQVRMLPERLDRVGRQQGERAPPGVVDFQA